MTDVAAGDRSRILAINGGSSSLKFALFTATDPPSRVASGRVENVGREAPRWISSGDDLGAEDRAVSAPDAGAAVGLLMEWIGRTIGPGALAAVGHRVVHGGPSFAAPERVTPEVLAELRRLVPLDPEHLPGEIAAIEAVARRAPEVPQVACFDTGFHRDLPREARTLPLPRRFEALGVRRYGFHGLSYAYLMEALARPGGPATGRVILAHLGSGASLAAVRGGRCVDTSMAFTPAAGLMMATRTGDIDPGLVRFLMRAEGLSPEAFDALVNRESGLLGVSETSPDVRVLLAARGDDPRADEAVALFAYTVKKWIGGFAAALGGLDTLVFSGGIGEHSAEVRGLICDGLGFLGVALDETRNRAHAPVISAEDAAVAVRVIATDEEIIIARAAARSIRPGPLSPQGGEG